VHTRHPVCRLYAQVFRGGPRARLQFTPRAARSLRGVHPEPGGRGLAAEQDPLRRAFSGAVALFTSVGRPLSASALTAAYWRSISLSVLRSILLKDGWKKNPIV
jgi:hypothetical protein